MKKLINAIVYILVMLILVVPVFNFVDGCIENQKDYCDPIYGIMMFPVILAGLTKGLVEGIRTMFNHLTK